MNVQPSCFYFVRLVRVVTIVGLSFVAQQQHVLQKNNADTPRVVVLSSVDSILRAPIRLMGAARQDARARSAAVFLQWIFVNWPILRVGQIVVDGDSLSRGIAPPVCRSMLELTDHVGCHQTPKRIPSPVRCPKGSGCTCVVAGVFRLP